MATNQQPQQPQQQRPGSTVNPQTRDQKSQQAGGQKQNLDSSQSKKQFANNDDIDDLDSDMEQDLDQDRDESQNQRSDRSSKI